ncbi:hypothetical protein TYRP_013980, partial [Tyrophagus putrescentiae]
VITVIIDLLHEHVFDKDDPSLAVNKTVLRACKAVLKAHKRTEKKQFKKELQQYSMINSIVENRQELEERTHDFEMLVQLRDYVKCVFFSSVYLCLSKKPPLSVFLSVWHSIKRVGNRYLVNDLAPLKPRFEEFMDKIKV